MADLIPLKVEETFGVTVISMIFLLMKKENLLKTYPS